MFSKALSADWMVFGAPELFLMDFWLILEAKMSLPDHQKGVRTSIKNLIVFNVDVLSDFSSFLKAAPRFFRRALACELSIGNRNTKA